MTAATPQCELLVQFLSSAVSGFENNLSDSRDDSTGLKVSCSPDGNWKSSNGEKVEKNGNVVCRTQGLFLQFLRSSKVSVPECAYCSNSPRPFSFLNTKDGDIYGSMNQVNLGTMDSQLSSFSQCKEKLVCKKSAWFLVEGDKQTEPAKIDCEGCSGTKFRRAFCEGCKVK